MKLVDLGEPTSSLDPVYLGCTQRECKPNESIIDQKREMFESCLLIPLHSGHITACYSKHDSNIYLVHKSLGAKSDRIENNSHPRAQRTLHSFCVVFHACKSRISTTVTEKPPRCETHHGKTVAWVLRHGMTCSKNALNDTLNWQMKKTAFLHSSNSVLGWSQLQGGRIGSGWRILS